LKIFLPDVVDERSYRLVNDASMRFVVFLSDLVERCAEDPADSLIDHLISHKVAGHLSGDELLATIRGVFTAGFETTAATISALLLAISRSPELLQQLRSDASSLSVAVDEGLRWETPVQVVTRYIEKGMLLGGHRIPEGACLWLLLGSANHDDQVFDEPEVFRLRTNSAHHLAFGGGRHKCAGLGLARVELIGFLQEFSRLAREVKVDESQLERHQNLQFRSIRKLPIEILPTEERCGLG
jgi:cytochrome P450